MHGHVCHHLGLQSRLHRSGVSLVRAFRERFANVLRTQIGGHHNNRIPKIDCAALPVSQSPILEDLKQDVEHVWMRLLDLIEQ